MQFAVAFELRGDLVVRLPLPPSAAAGSPYDWLVAKLDGHQLVLGQMLLAALGAALVTATTGRLYSRRAAWIAAFASAGFAAWIWTSFLLEPTSLALFGAALFGWCIAGEARIWRALLAGATLGLWTLVQENALLLLAALLPWGEHRRLPYVAAAGAGLLLVIVPWIAAYRSDGGEGWWTTPEPGASFFIGNGADATGAWRELPAPEPEQSPAATSLAWIERGVGDILDAPQRAAWRLTDKALLATAPSEPLDRAAFEAYLDASLLLRALSYPFSFAPLFVLGVLGAVLAGDSRRSALPLLISIALLVFGLLVLYVSSRYRLATVPLALPFAAHGVVILLRRFTEGGGRTTAILIVLLPVLALRLPRPVEIAPSAVHWSRVTALAVERNLPADAREAARRALAADPAGARRLLAPLSSAPALDGADLEHTR